MKQKMKLKGTRVLNNSLRIVVYNCDNPNDRVYYGGIITPKKVYGGERLILWQVRRGFDVIEPYDYTDTITAGETFIAASKEEAGRIITYMKGKQFYMSNVAPARKKDTETEKAMVESLLNGSH